MPRAVIRVSKGFGWVCLGWLLIGFWFDSSALAQYSIDSWTTDNGLPHNWIRTIHQTRDGYLWLPTKDGLTRFDGVRFKVFNRTNTPGLTSNRFSHYALCEDRHGTLWLGTQDGGVVRYRDGVFTALTKKDGLPSNEVVRIDEDATGTIWIFTNPGLTQWKDGRLIRLAPEPGSPFNDYLITPKALGENGRYFGLWRLETAGWHRFAYGQWAPMPLPPHLTDPMKLRIRTIFEDLQRRLWYSVVDRPGEYYCFNGGRLTTFSGVPSASGAYVSYQDRQGRLWVGNRDGLVGLWKDGQFIPLEGIATHDAFRVLEDREGTHWIATLRQGLYRFREQVITVHRHPGGLESNVMFSILQDRAGQIWLSSGGLTRFDGGRFENYYRSDRTHNTWDWTNKVTALHEDRDGSLWVGTWDGVARFKDGRLRKDDNLSAEINGRISAIRRDRAGYLWIGTDQGLYGLHDGKLQRVTAREGLSGDAVRVIYEDRAGRVWIGTNGGLSQYRNGTFSSLTSADGLSQSPVTSLYEDETGVLWVGTLDGGLNRLEEDLGGRNQRKITRYTTEHGLFNDGVYQILEDDLGFFWMSCHLGIYRVRKQELNDFAAGRISLITSTHFGKADGLVNTECSVAGQPAGFKDRDGKLWFPTEEGVAVVDPKAVIVNPRPPPVLIEECIIDNQSVGFRNPLRIGPGQENLEIRYTGLSLIKSEQMRFKYKLEGLNQDWVDAGTRRAANYSHVPPGEYVFKVIAANSDGIWNTQGESLGVVVLPPFYRTWWFLTLVGVTVVGIVLFGYEYRIRQLHREQALQQAFSRQLISSQEAERKFIAREIHDELGQSLTALKVDLSWVAEKLPQDDVKLSKRIEDMSSLTGSIIETVQKIATELRPGILDNLGLIAAIEWLCEDFSSRTGVACSLESLEDVDGLDQAQSTPCFRILQESLTNIARHANATEVRINLKREGDSLILQIQDNGRGISESEIAKRTSIGLLGMKERAEAVGGEFNIKGISGKGTTVTVTIPLTSSAGRSGIQ